MQNEKFLLAVVGVGAKVLAKGMYKGLHLYWGQFSWILCTPTEVAT
jgi:hypothetical protein